jgi:hypothetical protein
VDQGGRGGDVIKVGSGWTRQGRSQPRGEHVGNQGGGRCGEAQGSGRGANCGENRGSTCR